MENFFFFLKAQLEAMELEQFVQSLILRALNHAVIKWKPNVRKTLTVLTVCRL